MEALAVGQLTRYFHPRERQKHIKTAPICTICLHHSLHLRYANIQS
nr:MAG TPA: hypothetical protein [Caudoviricetes sp.]